MKCECDIQLFETIHAASAAVCFSCMQTTGEVKAQFFDLVSVYFSDIVGFTTLAANSSPILIVSMLNSLFR